MPVNKLDIASRGPYASGRLFGEAGPYEYLHGTLHFAVDPDHRNNKPIVDLDKVPAKDGKVVFSADFALLKPLHPASGGRLIYDVVNRGGKTIPRNYNWSSNTPLPDGSPDPGDGFLMRHGFTQAFCGWQVDVPAGMRMEAPVAYENGEPVKGQAFLQFTPVRAARTQLLSDRGHKPVPVHDLHDPDAVLTVREHPDAPPRTIPRGEWQFARDDGGKLLPDKDYVYLSSGFQPGLVYEVTYTSSNWPVIGLGFLATRDCVSFLRYGSEEQGNPCAGSLGYAYAFGASMSGRYLRELMYLGLNEDEEGHQVFDGLHVHTGSSRRGEFNMRFGEPSGNITRAPGNAFPFTYREQTDAITGQRGSILGGLTARGRAPKVVATNSGVEYWWSGASLTHTDVQGRQDVDPPDTVRVYYLAGSHHTAGTLELTDQDASGFRAGNLINPLDYTPIMRAVLLNLDRSVREGATPPPSRYPRIADGTAATREEVKPVFDKIPGAKFPAPLPLRRRLDFGPNEGAPQYPPKEGAPYQTLVSAVDGDGNEIAGVRLPDLTVPLGTYTGWNVRHAEVGGAGNHVVGGPLLGSVFPFAKTAQDKAPGDPRPAIDERYPTKGEYLTKVRAAAQDLAGQGYILDEDVDVVVELARKRYDLFRG